MKNNPFSDAISFVSALQSNQQLKTELAQALAKNYLLVEQGNAIFREAGLKFTERLEQITRRRSLL